LLNARGGGQLDGIAACLAQPPLNQSSIIMLCEADWRSIRARGREMPRELAARLGMSLVYLPQFACRPMHGSEGASTGNAVLSVTPFDEIRAVPVHNPKVGNRGYRRTLRAGRPAGIVARARHRGHLLTIGVAHLASDSDPGGREKQMLSYLSEFPKSGPAVFGGDLNTTTTELLTGDAVLRTCATMLINPGRFRRPAPYEPLFEHLERAGLDISQVNAIGKSTFTFSGIIPPFLRPKLDWLAIRGLRAIPSSARVIAARPSLFSSRVSDHDFVTVEIDL